MESALYPKIKIVFLPYVLVSVIVIAIFSLAKWFFEVKHRILLLDDFVFDIVASVILSFVLIVTVLRRRVHILDVRDKQDMPNHTSYYLFLLISIVIPVNFAISYVGSACYGLKHVKSADEIMMQPHTRYYDINILKPDTANKRVWFNRYTSGRHQSTLNFNGHAMFPVKSEHDTTLVEYVWYVMTFETSMSNSLSDDEEERAMEKFKTECNQSIEAVPTVMVEPTYYDNEPQNDIRGAFTGKLGYDGITAEQCVILTAEYGSFSERTNDKGRDFIISWVACVAIIFCIIMATNYNQQKLQQYYDNSMLRDDDLQKVIHYLHTHRYHPLALLLMVVVIALFVLIIKLFG
jgi:hypothetical protein